MVTFCKFFFFFLKMFFSLAKIFYMCILNLYTNYINVTSGPKYCTKQFGPLNERPLSTLIIFLPFLCILFKCPVGKISD